MEKVIKGTLFNMCSYSKKNNYFEGTIKKAKEMVYTVIIK